MCFRPTCKSEWEKERDKEFWKYCKTCETKKWKLIYKEIENKTAKKEKQEE